MVYIGSLDGIIRTAHVYRRHIKGANIKDDIVRYPPGGGQRA